MSENQSSPQGENSASPDDTFAVLLDDYGTDMYTLGNGGYGKSADLKASKQAITDHVSALNAEIDIAKRAIYDLNTVIIDFSERVKYLESRQITPDMLKVWADWQTIQRYAVSEIMAIRQSEDLRSDLWHAFNAMMEGDKS